MTSKATTVAQYLNELPAERREAMTALHAVILKNLPKGFKETISYGMIGYVVPQDIPFDLIGKLVKKVSVKKWIEIYEKNLKKSK